MAAGHQGKGFSGRMLAALRENAGRLGFHEVVAPVRPSGKHLRAALTMEEYVRPTRAEDGLPETRGRGSTSGRGRGLGRPGLGDGERDARAVAGVDRAAVRHGGPVEVPGALAPVRCSPAHGYAVHTEPHVWVRHRV